jgi:adenylyltransferase/sulfurtransferase
MAKITCKYFTTVLNITKKDGEIFDVAEGITVDNFLKILVQKYGDNFRRNVFSEGTLDGKHFSTPNIFLNKKRIQWVQDFPKGLKTKLKDGDEFWLGLIAGGGNGPESLCELSETEKIRFHRQMIFEGWGEETQKKLKNSRVFVAGAGGLGSPVSIYLAVAGVGTICICDHGEPELSNLNRQILHDDTSIGKNKALSAQESIERLNPESVIEPITDKILDENVAALVGKVDLIVDCMDNFDTRHTLNRYAVKESIPMIHAGVFGMQGQMTFIKTPETPCLWCINPGSPPPVVFPIVGATAGVMGCIQALEAIKYLSGVGSNVMGTLLIWDGSKMEFSHLPQRKVKNCPVCGGT